MSWNRAREINKGFMVTGLEMLNLKARWWSSLSHMGVRGLDEFLLKLAGGKLNITTTEAAGIVETLAELRALHVIHPHLGTCGLTDAELSTDLRRIASSAKGNLAECQKQMFEAVTGNAPAKCFTAVEAGVRWGSARDQRGGKPVPDACRASPQLMKKLDDGLSSTSDRRLPDVELGEALRTAAQSTASKKNATIGGQSFEITGVDEATKKVSGDADFCKALYLLFTCLAAVCTRSVELEKDGGPRGSGGVVASRRTDASLPEVMDAHEFLLRNCMRLADLRGRMSRFHRFWTRLQQGVTWSDPFSGRMTVAAALVSTLSAMGEWAADTPYVGKNLKDTTRKRDRAEATAAGRVKAKADRAAKEKAEKADDVKKGRKDDKAKNGPNSSGQVCGQFKRGGSCQFGAYCRHRHLSDVDDDDSADTRE
jgi:hypothetical protein